MALGRAPFQNSQLCHQGDQGRACEGERGCDQAGARRKTGRFGDRTHWRHDADNASARRPALSGGSKTSGSICRRSYPGGGIREATGIRSSVPSATLRRERERPGATNQTRTPFARWICGRARTAGPSLTSLAREVRASEGLRYFGLGNRLPPENKAAAASGPGGMVA